MQQTFSLQFHAHLECFCQCSASWVFQTISSCYENFKSERLPCCTAVFVAVQECLRQDLDNKMASIIYAGTVNTYHETTDMKQSNVQISGGHSLMQN